MPNSELNQRLFVTDNIDVDKSLFRYMSLAQFLSIVENKQLFLNKIQRWEDPWEGPDEQIPTIMENGRLEFPISTIKSETVGQCWTYEKDSDAMWRIYSPDRQGVMIETTVEQFQNIQDLDRAVLAKVIYFNEENFIEKRMELQSNKSYKFVNDMALKREAFKHENEVRLLMCLAKNKNIPNYKEISVLGIRIEPERFIKSITFDPRADQWFVDTMKQYCVSRGFQCPIQKSELYNKNFYEKTHIVQRYIPV